jgi:Ankyrin repeats (3 copies)
MSVRSGRILGLGALALLVIGSAGWSVTKLVAPEPPSMKRSQASYVNQAMQAIAEDDLRVLGGLLKRHPDLTQVRITLDGSLLHMASRINHTRSMTLLLDSGASLGMRGGYDSTPLHWACWWGNVEAAKVLLDHGASLDDRNDAFGGTPLLWAAQGSMNINNPDGHYDQTILLLLERGASADTYNKEGVPAIALASGKIGRLLAEHGAKVAKPATRPAIPRGNLAMGTWAPGQV